MSVYFAPVAVKVKNEALFHKKQREGREQV